MKTSCRPHRVRSASAARSGADRGVAASLSPSRHRVKAACAVLLVLLLGAVQCREAPMGMTYVSGPDPSGSAERVGGAGLADETRAISDPLAFLESCRQGAAAIDDYRCVFLKQERLGDELRPEQVIEVLCRESPFSVRMTWLRNAGRATSARYIAGRNVDEQGRELALFKPSGVISLLVPELLMPIHGEDARRDARRSLDQFGFRNTLDLVLKYCREAKGDPGYELRYTGPGEIDRRPTWTFQRRLPYTGPDGYYPDKLLIVHLDREWRVPLACLAYADDARETLLGSYVFTEVEVNVGLTEEDFGGADAPPGDGAARTRGLAGLEAQ